MDYVERPLKTNPDGTIPLGRPAIKRPSAEFCERVDRAMQLGKELGFEDEYNKIKASKS
jgi:hypothetical protein